MDVEQVGAGGRVVVHREAPAAPEEVGEPGGVVVVLSEALHVVLEGVDAGGGQQAHLAHPAAEALAEPVAPVDAKVGMMVCSQLRLQNAELKFEGLCESTSSERRNVFRFRFT